MVSSNPGRYVNEMTAVLVFLLLNSGVYARQMEIALVLPVELIQAGQQMEFSVYFHNPTDAIIDFQQPDALTCRLSTLDQNHEVDAVSLSPAAHQAVDLSPGRFIKARYQLVVPESLNGTITVELTAFDDVSAKLVVDPAPMSEENAQTAGSQDKDASEYHTLDSLFDLYQPYIANISAYEPMYFLVGTNPKDSKFQFSLKYRFLNSESRFAQKYEWLLGFHLAYTQTSFWDLKSDSAPFEDTSYKPEFFYLSSHVDIGSPQNSRLFLQTGFQHESNGRGGDASRSTNYLYAKPIFIFYNKPHKFGIEIAPKVWAYIANDNDTNPDLDEYRGYFDLELKFGKADSLVLGSHLRWAQKGGSVLVDLTYPLHHVLAHTLDLYLQVQYVNALAENLIDYTERTEAVRIGLAIVR